MDHRDPEKSAPPAQEQADSQSFEQKALEKELHTPNPPETTSRPASTRSSVTVEHHHLPPDVESRVCGRHEDTATIWQEPVKVPKSERRGLLARFAILAEVDEPKAYSRSIKWFITAIVAFSGAAAPMGSAIFLPSLDQVAHDMHTSPTVTNLAVALYMLSMSIFPLWWSAFSETFGRRTIYLWSFSLFLLFTILSAVATSIGELVVFRMLSGGAAASVQAVGAGTIADVWEIRERGRAMGIFYLGPLCGPLFAPIVGGALAQRWDWRSTQWFLAIYGGVNLLFLLFALPETLKNPKAVTADAGQGTEPENDGELGHSITRMSTRQTMNQKTKKVLVMTRMIVLDPLKIVLYLRFPAVLLTVYYASITFGSLYVLNVSLQYSFGKSPYNFSTIILGLLYIPNSVGYIISSIFGGPWMDRIMHREAVKRGRYDEEGRLIYQPEDRMLENAWLGAIMYPVALIWYGWSVEKGVFWLCPMVANFFFGLGSMLIFSMVTTMLTEFMPHKASNGVAVNNFVRNIFSCVGAIVSAPLIDAIGNGWLFTILGLTALASSSVIWAMKHYGPRWRVHMDANLV